jgi:hypothetical protein
MIRNKMETQLFRIGCGSTRVALCAHLTMIRDKG